VILIGVPSKEDETCCAISAKQDAQKKGLHILLNKPFSATVLPEKTI